MGKMSELHFKILEASRHVPLFEEPAPPQPETATLRDQFAMALVSSGKITGYPETVAKKAYEYADAMLKERESK